jgi:hypothetical protein
LLLERLPSTEVFMKNFAVEVLRYLLPSFDDNDELLGIEIMDFSLSLFSFSFFFFYKGSPASYFRIQ